MRRGGYYPTQLERVRDHYPIITHGLTMSLGAVDAPDERYLEDLDAETKRLGTPWHSDHLCFSTAGERVLHDLLPLTHSQRTVEHVSDRISRVRDRLGLPIAIENISWYAHPGRAELPEHELINRILDRADASLLLDVNNVYVNSLNHGFEPRQFIEAMPFDRVVQLHVAGHTRQENGLVIDTHGADVCDPVLELLELTVARIGPVPVVLERDNQIPPLTELLDEVERLDEAYRRGLARRQKRQDARARGEGNAARS